MAYFDKKWSQLSGDESRAMKEKYGSRRAWQAAKAKAQSHQSAAASNQSAAPASTLATSQSTTSQTTKPASYTSQTNSRSAASTRKPDIKAQTYEKASAYLRNHPNAGRAGTKDAGFEAILKEGGLNNHMFGKMQKAERRNQYEKNRDHRDASNEAFAESRRDLTDVRNSVGPNDIYNRQSARKIYERDMSKANEKPGNSSANNSNQFDYKAALYDSGYDFNNREYLRHSKDGKEVKLLPGLYDEYGGYQNWYDNHSLFTGTFKGSKDLMEQSEVFRIGQAQQDASRELQLSNDYMDKFGQYDWAQNYYNKYAQNG